MNQDSFDRRTHLHLAALRHLITSNVRKTGDKSEDCQQCACLLALGNLEAAIDGTTEQDLIPHAIFREPIACTDDAKRLFRYLHARELIFHPEEDPADIHHRPGEPYFTADESCELRERMREAWEQEWSEYDDPCGFILSLTPEDSQPLTH